MYNIQGQKTKISGLDMCCSSLSTPTIIVFYLLLSVLHGSNAGCSVGVKNLPLQTSNVNSRVIIGRKYYLSNNVAVLAKELETDIDGIGPTYATEIAQSLLYTTEDNDQTFTFCVRVPNAEMKQFEINTKRIKPFYSVNWKIGQASLIFKTERAVTTEKRRRRGWGFGRRRRRRCTTSKLSRGVTKAELLQMKTKLNNIINPPSSRRRMSKSKTNRSRSKYHKRKFGGELPFCPPIAKTTRPPIVHPGRRCRNRGRYGRRCHEP